MSEKLWRSLFCVHLCFQFTIDINMSSIFLFIFQLDDGAVKLAVVSNFDSRLRNLLKDLDVLDL